MNRREKKDLYAGLAFIAPNVLGFMAFTFVPLIMSLLLAFTNWNLRLHNDYRSEPLKFVGFDNFLNLLNWNKNPDFYTYLGNTLFLMLGLPIGIAASLGSALLLSRDLKAGGLRQWGMIIAGAFFAGSVGLLAAIGSGTTGTTIVLMGIFAMILVGGSLGGVSVYRTLFYIPNFAAGVATMLLWKKLFNPVTGPLNAILAKPVAAVGTVASKTPAPLWHWLSLFLLVLAAGLIFLSLAKFWRLWRDGEMGTTAVGVATLLALLATATSLLFNWFPGKAVVQFPIEFVLGKNDIYRLHTIALSWPAMIATFAAVLATYIAVRVHGHGRTHACPRSEGMGWSLLLGGGLACVLFAVIGIANAVWNLPAWSSVQGGLQPPRWILDVAWAKPSLMLMGFWGAIGSQTMLLYLAALTNVPPELYEAAEIDGATGGQRFWSVTWPQLAPTTFFVVVMGVIGGLQSGFEAARVLTNGGPAGATTTLAYYIYNQGFVLGRLGFASAIAWVMFLMVLLVTLFNWKFGNRYVND